MRDATIDSVVTINALAAQAVQENITLNVTAPSTATIIYYGACVTAISGEATAANNCSIVAITVTEAPKADLTVAPPTASSTTVTRETTFTLSATVTNGGSASAVTTTLRWYRSPDATIGTDDDTLGSPVAVPALAVGASSASLSSGAIGAPNTPGMYHYGACVAAVNDEANTENNCSASVTITVPTIYTCPSNGTPKGGTTSGSTDAVVCERCNDGFKLAAPNGGVIGDDGTTCVATQYTCSNGAEKSGKPNTNADVLACQSCNPGFKLAAPDGGTIGDGGTTCVATQYTCSDGTAKTGKPNGNVDVAECASCLEGYLLNATTKACDPNPNFILHSNGVTVLCVGAAVGATGTVGGTEYTKRAKASIGTANAATTCTSGITDMSTLFEDQNQFNGDISHWDTSSVTNMNSMFFNAVAFNQDIGDWDTSKVTNMNTMFASAVAFNQNIGDWDTSMVADMEGMFQSAAAFNQDLSKWCVFEIKMTPPGFAATAFTAAKPNWGAVCLP